MKALEVKYLLEQMQKVAEDKVRLEKELLAALLERDQQIVQLRKETEDMGKKLDSLELESLEAEGKVNEDDGGGGGKSSPSAEEAGRDGVENAETDSAEKDIAKMATQVEATKLEGPGDDSRAEDGGTDEPATPEGPAENDSQQNDEVTEETISQVETSNVGSVRDECLANKEGTKEPSTSVTEPEESAGQTAVEGDMVKEEESEEKGSSTESATESDVPIIDNSEGQGGTSQNE